MSLYPGVTESARPMDKTSKEPMAQLLIGTVIAISHPEDGVIWLHYQDGHTAIFISRDGQWAVGEQSLRRH